MWRAIFAALLCAITPAAASTIRALSDAELYEAERVVDGTVIATHARWNATHTGLETVVTIAIDGVVRGAASATVELVVPGGTLDGARHVFLGAPSVTLGERARWFLRDRGDGQLGVYGWSQGKVLLAPAKTAYFSTNGMRWPTSTVTYSVNQIGSDDLPMADVIGAIDAAFAAWRVPCSALVFENAGMTNRRLATDAHNVMLFIEEGWVYGKEAAAATSLWIIDGEQTADIAVNGQHFTWAIGPSNSAYATTLDLQAVMTHEIGHFIGLGHSERAFDTMYYSWKPWQGQRTLSIDDKLGVCDLYPAQGDECGSCPASETCTQYARGRLCEGAPDPIGTPCNAERVECGAFCLFTAVDLSSGYCSRFCTDDGDCPLTHHCADASAGQSTVRVCFDGPQMPQQPPYECVADASCPIGQHCDVARGTCTFECRVDSDCATRDCDDRGVCVGPIETGSGGGCNGGGGSIVVLIALAFRRRRR
jgi:hypothetical protein